MRGRLAGYRGRLTAALLLTAAVTSVSAAPAGAALAAPAARHAGTGVLDDVTVLSARDAWAVGHAGIGPRTRVVIAHWNGTYWKQVVLPKAEAGG